MRPGAALGSCAIGCLLVVSLSGCSASRTAGPEAPSESPAVVLSHPPYDAGHPPYNTGHGRLNGTFVRSDVATYPIGPAGRPMPVGVVVVRWEAAGQVHDTEFLVGYPGAGLVVNGNRYSRASSERIALVLSGMGAGTPVEVSYSGGMFSPHPVLTPPRDYPYAFLGEISVNSAR